MEIKEIRERMKAANIDTLRIDFPDVYGICRSKMVPAKRLEELTEEERREHFEIVSKSVTLLRQTFNPDGFNIGINTGKAAGAGIEEHIHTHIVPRWHGDTNYMTVLSDVRVMPEALAETYNRLKEKMAGHWS